MDVVVVEKHFGVMDFVIFIGLLVASAAIGAYFAYRDRRNASIETYYYGDRKMSPLAVSMSMAVSFVSAITIIGYPVEVYLYGTAILWAIPAFCLASLFAIIYYVPLIHRLRLRTIYQYLEMRYDTIVRRLCSGLFIPESLMYMGITVYLPALALNAVTPLNLSWSIVLTSVICTFYTSVGGMKAVIWTDVLQGTIMIFGSMAMFIKATVDVGGFGKVVEAVERGHRNNFAHFEPDLRVRTSPLSFFIGMFILQCIGSCCTQVYAQRYLSCKNKRDAQIAGMTRVVPTSIFVMLATANGMAMYAYYEGCDPTSAKAIKKVDQTTPRMAVEIFHNVPGMAGLFVSAAYSGTLSTVSSGINALSAMALEDFVKPKWPDMGDTATNIISKALSLLFGLIVMTVAFITSLADATVIQVSMVIAGILGGPALAVYTMGIFVPWTNKWGAIFGMITGWLMSLWISISAIVYPASHEFRKTLPLSTGTCNFTGSEQEFTNSTTVLHGVSENGTWSFSTDSYESTTVIYRPPLADTLYSISPFLYGAWGFLVGCVAMFVISLVTGRNKASEMDPRLFVPLIDNKKVFPKCIIKFFRFGVPELEKSTDKELKLMSNGSPQEEKMLPEKDELMDPKNISPINSTIDMRL